MHWDVPIALSAQECQVAKRLQRIGKFGLDHRVGHPVPFDLPNGSSRWTEGSRGYLDSIQYCRKHRARFLPEKPFRRGRAIRTREQEVVHRREARALSAECAETCPLRL